MVSVTPDLLFFNLLDEKNNVKKYTSIPAQKQGVIPITPQSSFQINNDNIQFNGNVKLDPENAEDGLVLTCDEDGVGKWEADTSSGNVTGPASSIQFNIPQFADNTGKLLSDSSLAQSLIGNVFYTGIPTMPTTGEICIFDDIDGFKIKNSGVQFPLVAGSSGQVLTLTGTGNTSQWNSNSGGDVSSNTTTTTVNRLALFSNSGGKLIKESSLITDTGGALAGLTQLNVDNLQLNTNLLTTTSGNLELDSNTNFVDINSDVQISGDLTVTGTTTTTESENVLIDANYLNNNTNYITTVAQTGGLTVRYLPTATNDTQNGNFTAGIPAVSNPTLITTGSATFASSDIIAIDSAVNNSNNGLYEVDSHSGTTLTIRGIGTVGTIENFTNNQFVADATLGATIRKVNVSIIRADTSGDWETGKGDSTGITYNTISTGGGGGGDVTGPASSADNSIVVFNSTTGKIIKETGGLSTITSTTSGGLGTFELKNDSVRIMFSDPSNSNVSIGYHAGNAWNPASTNRCTAIGSDSQPNNIDCIDCVSIGRQSLFSLQTGGSDNIAIGNVSMASKTSGSYCTAIGTNSQQLNQGSNTTSLGFFSLVNSTNSSECVALGVNSCQASTGGDSNTCIGFNSSKNCDGSNNTIIGRGAASAYTGTESQNIVLGLQSGVIGDNLKIRIGNNQTNTFIKGIHGVIPTLSTETVIIDSNGEMGSIRTGAVQRSRSTSISTTGSYTNVTFTDTDIETNTDLLSASGSTDIEVERDGLIEVSFQAICDPPNDDEVVFNARIQLNGSAATVGTITQNIYQAASDKEDWSMIHRTILLECSTGDTLTVQIRDQSGGAITLKGGSIIFTAKYLG